MSFSRANPSPRYRELVELYRRMHLEGERFLSLPPQNVFPGHSLPPQATRIKGLIVRTGAASILDYGSGKGKQYAKPVRLQDGAAYDTMQDYWDVDYIQCFDPSYPPYSELPSGKFDGVISTDVLEHCPEDDIEWILDEIFGFARLFVFANIACYPAVKRLPTGENAHCTIRPPEWWAGILRRVTARHPGVGWEIWIETQDAADAAKVVETKLASGGSAA
jgi:hypothetical protein